MVYTCEDGKRTHYSEAELGLCDLCRVKLVQDEKRMLFEFARVLNNYRRFESDEDVYHLIDIFLSSYDSCDQPERSKREDSIFPVLCSTICTTEMRYKGELEMRCSELYGNIERDK